LRRVLGHPVVVTVVRLRVRFAGTGIAVMMKGSVGHRRSRAEPEGMRDGAWAETCCRYG
jgi:hypothetical protein